MLDCPARMKTRSGFSAAARGAARRSKQSEKAKRMQSPFGSEVRLHLSHSHRRKANVRIWSLHPPHRESSSMILRRDLLILLVSMPSLAFADDWPQWRGPNRDGVWRESGVVEKFAEKQLKPKWSVPIGT